eukprot:403361297
MESQRSSTSGDIKKIDKTSILQICSSQVVIDLKSAVKELVENSLDAGASSIDIKFHNYGLNGFEVIDDGHGIKEVDFDVIAKRGTTSKINEFEDIYAVKSLGFRGEALSSLCNISNVTIQTKRPDQNTGWQIRFNHLGDVISKEQMAKQERNNPLIQSQGPIHDKQNLIKHQQIFFYLNKRPIDIPRKFKNLFSEIYRQYNPSMNPMIFMNIEVEDNNYDINVSPDKRDVFLKNEDEVIEALRIKLTEFYEDIQRTKAYEMSSKVSSNVNSTPLSAVQQNKLLFTSNQSKQSDEQSQVNVKKEDQNNGAWIKRKRDYSEVSNSSDKQNEIPYQNTSPKRNLLSQRCGGSKIISSTLSKYQQDEDHSDIAIMNSINKGPYLNDSENEEEFDRPDQPKQTPQTYTLKTYTPAGINKSSNQSSSYQIKTYGPTDSQTPNINNFLTSTKTLSSGLKLSEYIPTNQGYTLGVQKPSNSNIIQGQTKTLSSGLKLTEYIPQGLKDQSQFNIYHTDSLHKNDTEGDSQDDSIDKPVYDENLQMKRTNTIMDKIQNVQQRIQDSQLPKGQQKASNDFDEIEDSQIDSKVMSKCLKNYETKLHKENEKVLNAIARFEVNQDLRNFDSALSTQHQRQKLNLEYLHDDDIEEGGNLEDQEVSFNEILKRQMSQLRKSQVVDNEDQEKIQVITSMRKINKIDDKYRPPVEVQVNIKLEDMEKFVQESIQIAKAQKLNKKSPIDSLDISPQKDALAETNGNIQMDEKELLKRFKKDDFKNLQVKGQFNSGFIMATLNEHDLFILDQHACDEKYNFENFSRTTVIESQDLMHPIQVDLSVTDALAVKMHSDVFRMNGFKVVPKNEEDEMCNTYLIKSLPFVKKATFSVDDFYELLNIVSANLDLDKEQTNRKEQSLLHKELLRPSKIYSNLASRACRTSIMVGTVLDNKTMNKVVNNLATLESPWNCPHGRPTMRLLKNLENLQIQERPRSPPRLMRL